MILAKLKKYIRDIWHITNTVHIQSEQHIMALQKESPISLNRYEHKTYSQYGEDGIIEQIFARIGATTKTFFEIGSGDGLENNTINLLIHGWKGWWVDGNPSYLPVYNELYQTSISAGKLKVEIKLVSKDSVNDLVKNLGIPAEIDLLSLDVDGNDYYIWQALTAVNPRVFMVEYNASHGPNSDFLQKESAVGWNGTNFFGASLKTFNTLAKQKGYSLVACSLAGTNAFFVRTDLLGDKFEHAGDVEKIYQKPRYYLSYYAGHRPGMGQWQE